MSWTALIVTPPTGPSVVVKYKVDDMSVATFIDPRTERHLVPRLYWHPIVMKTLVVDLAKTEQFVRHLSLAKTTTTTTASNEVLRRARLRNRMSVSKEDLETREHVSYHDLTLCRGRGAVFPKSKPLLVLTRVVHASTQSTTLSIAVDAEDGVTHLHPYVAYCYQDRLILYDVLDPRCRPWKMWLEKVDVFWCEMPPSTTPSSLFRYQFERQMNDALAQNPHVPLTAKSKFIRWDHRFNDDMDET